MDGNFFKRWCWYVNLYEPSLNDFSAAEMLISYVEVARDSGTPVIVRGYWYAAVDPEQVLPEAAIKYFNDSVAGSEVYAQELFFDDLASAAREAIKRSQVLVNRLVNSLPSLGSIVTEAAYGLNEEN